MLADVTSDGLASVRARSGLSGPVTRFADAALPRAAFQSSALAPHFDATPKCVGDFYGWKTTLVGDLLAKAPSTRDLVLHSEILQITEAALQPSCDCIQLNLTQAIRVHPEERAQAPHRDEEMWPHEPKLKPWLINVMWPLTNFTEENGATRLWPESHCSPSAPLRQIGCVEKGRISGSS